MPRKQVKLPDHLFISFRAGMNCADRRIEPLQLQKDQPGSALLTLNKEVIYYHNAPMLKIRMEW